MRKPQKEASWNEMMTLEEDDEDNDVFSASLAQKKRNQ